jgi:hypothetical protein
MKNHSINSFCLILLYCCASIIFPFNISWSGNEKKYPSKINLITKNQADYKTPENTLAASFFALMYNDLEWFYETLTIPAVIEDKAMYEEAGIDINEKFKLVNPGDQLVILDKKVYKKGILIHSKGITGEGTIIIGPNVFVLENGLWKETYDYISDEEIHAYFDAAPPEEIFNTENKLFPNHWNYQWYKQVQNKKPEPNISDLQKVSVLCVLGNLTDLDGNTRSVEDIDPETLVLNYVVKPIPWHIGKEAESALLIQNDEMLSHLPYKSFENSEKQAKFLRDFKKPVLLIKFSKFEAIQSLDIQNDENIYTVSVSGKLKDNETHFRGKTQINLISPSISSKQEKTSPPPVVENLFNDHWWDQQE